MSKCSALRWVNYVMVNVKMVDDCGDWGLYYIIQLKQITK